MNQDRQVPTLGSVLFNVLSQANGANHSGNTLNMASPLESMLSSLLSPPSRSGRNQQIDLPNMLLGQVLGNLAGNSVNNNPEIMAASLALPILTEAFRDSNPILPMLKSV
uniref:Uncharacterized protein n=1 Tax=Acrobeloides nanus TaxID=290746 RepID=A0A914E211_9BILA